MSLDSCQNQLVWYDRGLYPARPPPKAGSETASSSQARPRARHDVMSNGAGRAWGRLLREGGMSLDSCQNRQGLV
jgi:hypothetical protein